MGRTLQDRPTVVLKQLRDAGRRVAVSHSRFFPVVNPKNGNLVLATRKRAEELGIEMANALPQGGCTRVGITMESGYIAAGVAWCSPLDNFSKAIGLEIALGRAVKMMKAVQQAEEHV